MYVHNSKNTNPSTNQCTCFLLWNHVSNLVFIGNFLSFAFLIAVTKVSDRDELNEGGFNWALSFRGLSPPSMGKTE